MAIRKHPTKGDGWWQIVISRGRNQPKEYFTYQGTEAEAIAVESDLRGVKRESPDQRINDVLGRFLSWYEVHRAKRTSSEAEAMLPKVIARIGNKSLALLRQHDFDRYKAQRLADGVKKRTINVELSYLRSLLKYAEEELKLPVAALPKLYTKRQTLPPSRTPLTPNEIARLLAELKGDKKTIVMLYAWCGLRRTEALQLTRRQVDLEAGLMHVHGKGDKSRIVPIPGAALHQRLEAACKGKKSTDFLFINKRTGEPYQDIKNAIKLAAGRAKIDKAVWAHLMRHSGATAAISAGVGLRELQDMLGHTDIRMTEIYTHLSAKMSKDAGAKIAAIHEQASSKSSNETGKKAKVYQIDRSRRH